MANELSYILIKTKLHKPSVSDDLIPRPRLVRRLNRGINRPLTLAIAPAGYGKTTLLAQWLVDCPRPVAWLSLDETDNDLALFLEYFIAAIQTVFPDACPKTSALLKTTLLPSREYLTATLINEIDELPEPFILILDDCHLLEKEAIHQLIEALVDSLLQRMHLVLAGRVEPPLPLARLRVGQQMTDLRAQDLRFTLGEVQAFLTAALGRSLADEVITNLEERTEGWIASLRLAALSMRAEADPEAFVRRFRGTHGDLTDYLMAEVLSHQSSGMQEFLLRTSILDRFCAPLCDTVTGIPSGESERLLEEIDRTNMFLVPLDFERTWYRYHHLFQGLLHHRLQAVVSEQKINTLHRKASTWFASQGLIEEALGHALAGKDVEGAARIVEDCRHDLLNREDWITLDRYLNQLPEEVAWERPALILARAWVLDFRYQTTRIPPLLRKVEACLIDDPHVWAESTRGLQAEIDALWSILLAWGGQGRQALERALSALERLPPTYAYARSFAMLILALAYQMSGQTEKALQTLNDFLAEAGALPDTIISRILIGQAYVHVRSGNLHQAVQVLHHLQQVADKARLTVSLVIANWLLGRISYEWNQLETASKHLTVVFEIRYGGHYGMVYDSSISLALTYQAQGESGKAEETLDALRKFSLDIGIVERLNDLDSISARLAILNGDLQSALRWAETIPLNIPSSYTFVWLELPIVTKIRVFITQGTEVSLHEATGLLQELLTFTESLHNTYRQIELLALLALAYRAQGRTDDALQALELSVKLAKPGGFIRTFVDLGPEMATLLTHLVERGVSTEYLGQVLTAFSSPDGADSDDSILSIRERTKVPDPLFVEPLTRRELEILKLLDQDLSNQEIAQALVISPLTVKRHASNIYAKLGASGRMKAVAKARTLGILPSD